MRRTDREVTDLGKIIAIMEQCDVCRIAFHDAEYPYLLPLNFGMEVADGRVELYFHGALEGKKYDLIRKNNKVCFEMDCGHRLVAEADQGSCTMEYESVIGQGFMEILPESEKAHALRILMKHYRPDGFPISQSAAVRTNVFKLTVERMTGKVLKKQR